MTILNVILRPADKANYSPDRGGEEISMLVIHVEEGTNEGTARWFAESAAHASAHYGVGKDGTVFLFVSEEATAWHAGNSVVNRRSIGIELEGRTDDPATFTDAMMDTLAVLCATLCQRYGIPIDREHIIGHNEVPDPTHPGAFGGAGHHWDPWPHFPWDRLMTDLQTAIHTVAV